MQGQTNFNRLSSECILHTAAGNRLWGKELQMQLTLVDWSPDARRLLFCTTAGECHIVDAGGNIISQVPLHCKV